jgi:phage shock protein E
MAHNCALEIPPYEDRKEALGLCEPEESKRALSDPKAYVLDMRSPEEIAKGGKVDHPNYRQSTGTSEGCPDLQASFAELLPDKDALIIVHCRSGKRAGKAVKILKDNGYTNVLNAGGYSDIKGLVEK